MWFGKIGCWGGTADGYEPNVYWVYTRTKLFAFVDVRGPSANQSVRV